MSAIWVVIPSDNGLWPTRHQPLTRTKADLLLIVPWKSKLKEKNQENVFENVARKMSVILFNMLA